jgi:hypothetical protein
MKKELDSILKMAQPEPAVADATPEKIEEVVPAEI